MGNAMGLLGTISVILLVELLVAGLSLAITGDSLDTTIKQDCDCHYIGGCSAYTATNGFIKTYSLCHSQQSVSPNLKDAYMNFFWTNFIVLAILFIINLMLVLAFILMLRGVPG